MIVFIDRQHSGKPGRPGDRGASADLDGDGRDEILGPILLDANGKRLGAWDLERDRRTHLRSLDSLTVGDVVPGLPLEIVLAEQGGNNEAITLNAEENKIRQVLANLLQNALRFSPDDTPIEVIVEKEDNPARGVISVVDHGEGIPLQLRDKIFQRLFRADTSRARDTGGSGLGLAIVDTIVRRHKGTIRVDETPGGGATFKVSLPLVPNESS